MTADSEVVSADQPEQILRQLRAKGARLWLEGGELRFRALKGSLAAEDITALRKSKAQIIGILERGEKNDSGVSSAGGNTGSYYAPLDFVQQEYWRNHELSERPTIRQVASAKRLLGALSIDALKKALFELMKRHHALRTRIVLLDGVPMQEVAGAQICDLPVIDLSAHAEDVRERKIFEFIDQLILEPIDIARGPLFGTELLKLSDNEHVLVVVMEHIVSDARSINIFMRDLLMSYANVVGGRPVSLPPVTVQPGDFSIWQRQVRDVNLEELRSAEEKRLAGYRAVRFPQDQNLSAPRGIEAISFKIDKWLKRKLCEWAQGHGTTLAMSVFVAYVALVLRWCQASQVVVRYQIDGRDRPELQNTIGYLASKLHVCGQLSRGDTFVDLLEKINKEYCAARECAYAAGPLPQSAFAAVTRFNWIPQGESLDLSVLSETTYRLECFPIRFVHPMQRNLHPVLNGIDVDSDPDVLFYDSHDDIACYVYFPPRLFSANSIERFGRSLLLMIGMLLSRPEMPVADVELY